LHDELALTLFNLHIQPTNNAREAINHNFSNAAHRPASWHIQIFSLSSSLFDIGLIGRVWEIGLKASFEWKFFTMMVFYIFIIILDAWKEKINK
jgi:hypothetical protein